MEEERLSEVRGVLSSPASRKSGELFGKDPVTFRFLAFGKRIF
jgi:hypothetical protein